MEQFKHAAVQEVERRQQEKIPALRPSDFGTRGFYRRLVKIAKAHISGRCQVRITNDSNNGAVSS